MRAFGLVHDDGWFSQIDGTITEGPHPNGTFTFEVNYPPEICNPITSIVHPRQCRRLIKKPRPAPPVKEERAEREHVWVDILGLAEDRAKRKEGKDWTSTRALIYTGEINLKTNDTFNRFVRLGECEVILDRQKLAVAWAEAFGAGNVFKEAMPKLAEALGLPAASKKDGGV